MATKRDITERTFDFATQVVKVCRVLDRTPGVNRTLARQLLRSGTSVGANVEEAQAGQSRADFVSKMNIALKECRETRYWLRLLVATESLPGTDLSPLLRESNELCNILGAIIVATKRNGAR
jgi:four helix bundle protein